jgi:hypothetical protein
MTRKRAWPKGFAAKRKPRPASLASVVPLARLAADVMGLGIEAQQVIALRLAAMASGRGSRAEWVRMVAEKPAASLRAQMAAAMVLGSGGKGHIAARKALKVYSNAVRANRRRLTKG